MMDALVPVSSLPVKVDGRNLLWRRMLVNAIRTDPEWKDGQYTAQPRGFLNIMPMFDMLVQSPVRLSERLATYDKADEYVRSVVEDTLEEDDANNILYRFEASFDYDPSAELIAECTDTINRYAHTRDQLDADAHANLFTEDAVFESGGTATTGRKAIAQRIRDTKRSAMTRHMSSSIVVSIGDKNAVTALNYFHVFQATRPESPRLVPVGSYLMVEYHD